MNKTWILIADGARAKVYQNLGPGTGLRETDFPEMFASHVPSRDIHADGPGRMQSAPGGVVHRMDYTSDPHREQKRDFAGDIAGFLKLQERENAFDDLIIVAPPKTLGDLRDALDKSVARHVTIEVAQDLTKIPVHELSAHLSDVLKL